MEHSRGELAVGC